MFVGFLLNQIFRALNLPNALSPLTLFAVLIPCMLAEAGIILKIRKGRWQFKPDFQLAHPRRFFFLIPTLFPVLAIAGAVNLNNGGSNLIALTTVLLLAGYALVIIVVHDQSPTHSLEFSLLIIGLSVILSYALRSWHISGWDINQEFYVYQLTKTHQQWQIEYFRDPYNACLSITILPTVINSFLGINDELVLKLVYPIIFAWVPLVIYLIARKYVSPIFSYLSSLFFIFQPWFIQPTLALARQEIALLFFALVVWLTFDEAFAKWQKDALLIVFGASLIVSHYSTSYVALGMLTLVFLISSILRIPSAIRGRTGETPLITTASNGLSTLSTVRMKTPRGSTQFISGLILLVFILFAVYWNNKLTTTSGNLTFVVETTLLNIKDIFNSDLRSEDIGLALGFTKRQTDINTVNNYIRDQSQAFSSLQDLYPPDTYKDFSPLVVTSAELPGAIESETLKSVLTEILSIVKQITKVLLVIGAISLIFLAFKTTDFDTEYILLSLISIAFLLSFLLIPVLSLYYNSFRVYVQTLIVSSLVMVVGANLSLSGIAKAPIRARLIGILLIVFFLSSIGLLSYIVGGPAMMNLTSSGEDYDKFYTHDGEVYSAQWLGSKREANVTIYADSLASLRLISFGNGILKTNTVILPSTFTRDSYVYLRYANVHNGITEAFYKGQEISYNYPIEFLEKYKNRIYDNGESQIFK